MITCGTQRLPGEVVPVRGWTVGISLAGIVLAVSALAWLASRPQPPDPDERVAAAAQPGMELLKRYRCHRAETKRIFLRGAEDGFSPEGDEPAAVRPTLRSPRLASLPRTGYDGSQADRTLLDHLTLPADIAGGLFVVSLRPVVDNANDGIVIGRTGWGAAAAREPAFGAFVPTLAERPGWKRIGSVHYAPLGEIRLQRETASPLKGRHDRTAAEPSGTLLDFVRARPGQALVDVQISDDTAVDFIGVAVCERPPPGTGLSFVVEPVRDIGGVIQLSCDGGNREERRCDPYVGDTSCAAILPVACFRDRSVPRPQAVANAGYTLGWSGGEVAFTMPRAGRDFATITAADALCRARFGTGWRTATYHEGGRPSGFIALGRPPAGHRRAWIDIKGQPYATCWSR